MAKRYSPFAVALLVSAFAVIGYLGARLSDRMSSPDRARATPPAMNVASRTGDRNAAAPSELSGTALAPKKSTEPAIASPPPAAPPPEAKEEKTAASPPPQEPASPPVVLLNPGSAERSGGQAKDPSTTPVPREQADVPKPDGRNLRKSERAAAVQQPPVDEPQVEDRRGKVARKQRSRDRQVAEQGYPPRRFSSREYGEPRGQMPPPGGPLLPILPFFLPF